MLHIDALIRDINKDILGIIQTQKEVIKNKTSLHNIIREARWYKKNKIVFNNQKEENRFNELLIKIQKEDLPEQIRIYTELKNNFLRIKRIISILKKQKSQKDKEERNDLNKLIKIIILSQNTVSGNLFNKSLISILAKQEKLLKENNYYEFRKEFISEINKYKATIKELNLEDIFNQIKEMKTDEKLKKARKIIYLSNLLALVWLINIVMIHPVQKNMNMRMTHPVQNQSEIYYTELNGKLIGLTQLIETEIRNDSLRETKQEHDFETLFKTNIIGQYHLKDLTDIREGIYEFYDETYFNKLGIKNLIFVGNKIMGEKLSILGLAYHDGNLVLRSSHIQNENGKLYLHEFKETFFHELAHFIHFQLDVNSEFNRKWKQIKGGYVDTYQYNNNDGPDEPSYEDVAVLVQNIIQYTFAIENRTDYEIITLDVIDNNRTSLQSKIRLLVEESERLIKEGKCGFFTPKIIKKVKKYFLETDYYLSTNEIIGTLQGGAFRK